MSALKYSIDKRSLVVTVIYLDNPSYKEWAEMMLDIFQDPDFEPGFSFILDHRLVQTPQSSEYIKNVVDFIEMHGTDFGTCSWAVITNNQATYGMMRMAQELSGEALSQMKAFSDIDEAKRWLSSFR